MGTGKKGRAASVPVCRNASFKRSGAWAVKKKNGGKWPVHKKAEKKPAADKPPRFYASEDIPVPFARRSVAKPATLKASITPGTVLILLAGRFRGKRVVFLKQLTSGLLLVTGPFKVNGVPLRRVNQTFTIATSTKVPLTGVDVSKIDDAYFAKAAKKAPKGADGFFEEGGNKEELSAQRKADQKTVDTALLANQEDGVFEGIPQRPLLVEQGRRTARDEVLSARGQCATLKGGGSFTLKKHET